MPARQPENIMRWDVSMSECKRYRMRGIRVAHLRELQPSRHWRAAAASCTELGPTDAKLMTMPLAACCISSALSDAAIVGVAGVLRWAGQPQSDPGCRPSKRKARPGGRPLQPHHAIPPEDSPFMQHGGSRSQSEKRLRRLAKLYFMTPRQWLGRGPPTLMRSSTCSPKPTSSRHCPLHS